MENILIKIKTFLAVYKWLLLPVVPAGILLIFLISLSMQPTEPAKPTTQIPTPYVDKTSQQPITQSNENFEDEGEVDEPPELRYNFKSKETKSDGTIVYTFLSENPQRPDISILTTNNKWLFSREINSKALPFASISVLTDSFGKPDRVMEGSKFYGPKANVYIYSSGTAFIGDPETDEVLEVQHFPPMSVEEYIKRFGPQN